MSSKKFQAWLWVVLCVLTIFLVVPTARTIQKFVSDNWGRSLFGYAVLAAVAAAFLCLLYILVFRLNIRSPANYIWLTAVAGLYVYFTLKLWRAPEEAVHFLEYGLLGYFLFRALNLTIKDKSVYPTAFLIGALVGTFDELLQWVTPDRYWDFRDVALNALAAGLFQIALWKGIKPRIISEKISPRSVRRVSILAAALVVILGFCASNTPQRVVRYVKRFPSLSFLLKAEPMYEFTRKHEDPEIGVFYSRLTLEGLQNQDTGMSDEWARILREWKDKDYSLFLSTYSPLIHPFLYEMRIHVFRRDRKLEQAGKAKKKKDRQENLFIAWKENLILEKYFGLALEKSSYRWDRDQKAEIEGRIDKDRPYRSPVSAGRFQVKEKALWAGILVFLAALAALNLLNSRAKRAARGHKAETRRT
jgi:VanZ family protein